MGERRIDRRKFLKLIGLGIGASALGAIGSFGLVKEVAGGTQPYVATDTVDTPVMCENYRLGETGDLQQEQ